MSTAVKPAAVLQAELDQALRERADYLDRAQRRALRILQLDQELRRVRRIADEAITALWERGQ